jgi:hypothetical protein
LRLQQKLLRQKQQQKPLQQKQPQKQQLQKELMVVRSLLHNRV